VLPWSAAGEAFRVALDGGDLMRPLTVIAAWGVAATIGAVRTFRWE
jgi:hypothetical protein